MNLKTSLANLSQIWAITLKELQLETRFWFVFLSTVLFTPLKTAAWFFVIYFGVFSQVNLSIGDFNRKSYILLLIIGSLFYALYNMATSDLASRFLNEKYWQTFYGFMIAPVNAFKLVLGFGASGLIKTSLAITVFLILGIILKPITLGAFLLILLIIFITFIGLMFLGLIRAVYVLFNENMDTIIEYAFLGLGFLSCFYYPIEAFPKFIQPVIYWNPIYQSIQLSRSIWLGQNFSWISFIIIVSFAIITAFFSTLIYNHLLKNHDIEGY